jgi:hypothetical protein
MLKFQAIKLSIALAASIAFSCQTSYNETNADCIIADSAAVLCLPPTMRYGIVADSLDIEYGKIGRGQTLSQILSAYGLP